MTITIGDSDVLLVVDVQNDFCPGGNLAVPERRRGGAGHQRAGAALPSRGADAGLASGRAPVVRVLASRPQALRHHRGRLRAADPVARPLRAGHARRRVPRRSRHPARGAGDPQGLPAAHQFLLGASTRTTARRRRGSPATCASAASRGCSSPASRSISACATRPRTRRREGFDVVVIEDACRGIDVGGSVAATERTLHATRYRGRQGRHDRVELPTRGRAPRRPSPVYGRVHRKSPGALSRYRQASIATASRFALRRGPSLSAASAGARMTLVNRARSD